MEGTVMDLEWNDVWLGVTDNSGRTHVHSQSARALSIAQILHKAFSKSSILSLSKINSKSVVVFIMKHWRQNYIQISIMTLE